MITKLGLFLAAALLMAGCAPKHYPWTRNITEESAAYVQDRYQCLEEHWQWANFGQRNIKYMACMHAHGWFIPAPKPRD